MRLVDAHVHLWDPDRFCYPWLAGIAPLRRPFGPTDLSTAPHELTAAVFVEAGRRDDQALDEVAWVERVAAGWPALRAIVAHVPTERGDAVTGHLTALTRHALVRGARRNVQDETTGFALRPAFVDGVRRLADFGLTFDLCVRHHQLPEVTELVRLVPEVTFVLDHLGKPEVRGAVPRPWRERLSRLADLPNVVCKLSGLPTEADPDGWRVSDVRPYLRHAIAVFGADRCLFGGDWPVATLATTYPRWVDAVTEAVDDLRDDERRAVFAETAARVYRFTPAAD